MRRPALWTALYFALGIGFTQICWGISSTHHTLCLYPDLSLWRGAVVAME